MQARVIDPVLDKNFKSFSKALKTLEALTLDSSGKVLWKYSSQFAAQLVAKTNPFGTGNRPRERGQQAVRRDIDKVYAKPNRIFAHIRQQSQQMAELFWARWKENDVIGVAEILRASGARVSNIPLVAFDGGAAHQRARKSRGRVNGDLKHSVLIQEPTSGKVLMYIKEIEENVGYSKAGWVSNFRPPGGVKGIPHWVRDKKAPNRIIDKTKSGVVRQIDFENGVPWISNQFNKRGVIGALKWVTRRMEKDIAKAAVDNAKKV